MPSTESTTALTPSMSAMLAALSAERGASVTDLSGRAKLGRSTAARVLTTLEGLGLARRERPDRSADHSSPDLWFTCAAAATEPAPAACEVSPERAYEVEPGAHAPEVPPETGVEDVRPTPEDGSDLAPESADTPGREGADAPALPSHEGAVPAVAREVETPATQPDAQRDAVAARDSGSGTGVAETGATDAAAPSGHGSTPRLAKGGLRELVVAQLAAHPGEDFTASKLGRALGKSSGAIANALDTLVKLGHAEMTCEKPRTFRHLEKAGS